MHGVSDEFVMCQRNYDVITITYCIVILICNLVIDITLGKDVVLNPDHYPKYVHLGL